MAWSDSWTFAEAAMNAYKAIINAVTSGAGVAITTTAGPPTSAPATIANAASLSDAVQVSGKLTGLITPATWTAAAITFSVSQDGVTYVDLYDSGTERAIASGSVPTSGARMLALSLVDWLCVNYVKVRSGTSASPVVQGGARVVTLILAG